MQAARVAPLNRAQGALDVLACLTKTLACIFVRSSRDETIRVAKTVASLYGQICYLDVADGKANEEFQRILPHFVIYELNKTGIMLNLLEHDYYGPSNGF